MPNRGNESGQLACELWPRRGGLGIVVELFADQVVERFNLAMCRGGAPLQPRTEPSRCLEIAVASAGAFVSLQARSLTLRFDRALTQFD